MMHATSAEAILARDSPLAEALRVEQEDPGGSDEDVIEVGTLAWEIVLTDPLAVEAAEGLFRQLFTDRAP